MSTTMRSRPPAFRCCIGWWRARRMWICRRASTMSGSPMAKWGIPRSAFFYSSRRRHTSLVSDWSSDVCSSDSLCVCMLQLFTNPPHKVDRLVFSEHGCFTHVLNRHRKLKPSVCLINEIAFTVEHKSRAFARLNNFGCFQADSQPRLTTGLSDGKQPPLAHKWTLRVTAASHLLDALVRSFVSHVSTL